MKKACHTCKYEYWHLQDEPCPQCRDNMSKWEPSGEAILKEENKRLRDALNKVQKVSYNEDCLFCGFKDRAVKEALEGDVE